MMGLQFAPKLAWSASSAGLATQHIVAGLSAGAAFALIHGIEDRGHR